MDVRFTLPGQTLDARNEFALLKKLTRGIFLSTASTDFAIPTASALRLIFSQNASISSARLDFKDRENAHYAKGFLRDTPQTARAALSFEQAAMRLQDKVTRVDHAGVNVPEKLLPINWLPATNFLAASNLLYEYPDLTDGYDKARNLWYFVLQSNRPRLRPMVKFELVHDGIAPHSCLQIDLKVEMGAAEAKALFPEGFQIEGLEDFIWSVPTKTSWPGARNLRLDLRFTDASRVNDHSYWETGTFLIEKGTPVKKGNARLPQHTAAPRSNGV